VVERVSLAISQYEKAFGVHQLADAQERSDWMYCAVDAKALGKYSYSHATHTPSGKLLDSDKEDS
jgi:hypothetical protein